MQVKNLSGEQVIRNSFWKFCESIGLQLLMLIITVVLARILSPHDYGLMAIIVIAANFLSLFVSSSISSYLIYVEDIKKQDFLTALVCNLLLSFVLVTIIILSSDYIAEFYSALTLSPMISAMAAIIPFCSIASVYNAYAMKMSMFKTLFWRNIISGPLSGILALVLANLEYGVWSLIWQQISYNVLLTIIMIFTIKVNVDGDWRFDFQRLKKMWAYGVFTLLSTIIGFISDSIGDLVIGKKINASQLGIYSRGNHFPNSIFISVNNVISNVFFPAFASYGHDIKLLKDKCRKSIRAVYSFACPVLFGLIACASPMVYVLLTDKWERCVPIIQIICCYFMAMPFLQMCSQVMLAVGSVRIRMFGEVVKMVFTFALLFFMIRYGIIGVAVSRVMVGCLMIAFTLVVTKGIMNYGLFEFLFDVSKPIIASAIMACVIYPLTFLPIGNLIILILQITLGVTIYFLLSKLLKNDEFENLIFKLLKERLNRK